MSNISNRHSVIVMTPKSRALTGQTLLKIQAKKQANPADADAPKEFHPALKASVCVSVPATTDDMVVDNIAGLMVHIKAMIVDTQKELVRELILNSEPGSVQSVGDDDISISKVVAYLDAENIGGRWTTDYLKGWFNDCYADTADSFCVRVCRYAPTESEPLTEMQIATVEKRVNGLRGIFELFASPKFKPETPHWKAVLNFAQFATFEDIDIMADNVFSKIHARCTKAKLDMENLETLFDIS